MSLDGLEHLVFEDSYLLGIVADGDGILLKAEFALAREHLNYSEPLPGEAHSYHKGEVRLRDVETLSQERGGPFLGWAPGGDIDLGSINICRRGDQYVVGLSIGTFTCRASSLTVTGG